MNDNEETNITSKCAIAFSFMHVRLTISIKKYKVVNSIHDNYKTNNQNVEHKSNSISIFQGNHIIKDGEFNEYNTPLLKNGPFLTSV